MESPGDRRHLLGASLDEVVAFSQEHGLPDYRARQVFEWVYAKGAADFAAMTNLPKPLRHQLAEQWMVYTSTVARRQESADGTIKLLLQWPDQATTECVLIPEGQRQTACLSSQVGCPVRCRFCASGLGGLERQLTTGQIVEQAMRLRGLCEPAARQGAHPQTLRIDRLEAGPTQEPEAGPTQGLGGPAGRLSHIVFMGLGEPLANYGAVLAAIRILNAPWGLNIGARKITVSTIGPPDKIRRLARANLQINLAISLHAPNDALRRELIPWARKVSIDDLVAAGRDFFDTTGREVTLEYLLLGGLNDQLEHARQLVRLCRQMRCNVNLIRYNPVAGLDFERPSSEATRPFLQQLRERGINAHVRKSRGLDIEAACGQLRRAYAGEVPSAGQQPATKED